MMQNIKEYQIQKRKEFQGYYKLFPRDDLHSLEDYIDLYLIYFGPRYRDYLHDFYVLLKKRKISFGPTCQLEEIILYRLMNGVYKNFQLGRRSELDQMDGVQFEVFLSKFFLHCGYSVEKTPVSHDFGADLIIQNYSGRFLLFKRKDIRRLLELRLFRRLIQLNLFIMQIKQKLLLLVNIVEMQ